VIVLFAVVAALLGAFGLGFATWGVVLIAEGHAGVGLVGVILGLPPSYGAYLFGRAAVRVRRDLREHPPSEQQESYRRRKVHYYVGYTAAVVIGAVVLPVPAILRVLMVVGALLALPPMLAWEFEPSRKRKPPGD
jgi:hypothetical protein